MNAKDTLIKNIKDYRESAGLTQAAFAARLRVNPVTVSGWETGRKEPSFAMLDAIAEVFGVSVSDLFTDQALSHVPKAETQAAYLLYLSAVAASRYTTQTAMRTDDENGPQIVLSLGRFRNQDLSRRCEGALALAKTYLDGNLSASMFESALRGIILDIGAKEKKP